MATLRQIQETLSQTSGAQYLYQPTIDRALITLLRKLTATRALLPRRTWNTPRYIFNKRSGYPTPQSVVEAPPTAGVGAVNATSSVYSQVSFPVKHWQVNLDLAKFSIQTARVNGDLMALELQAASEAAVWFEEALNFYGSSGATLNSKRPQWDGLDLLMATGNKVIANSGPSIALLDFLIDSVKRALGTADLGNKYAIVMTSELHSAFSRLWVQYERWVGKTTIYPRDDRGQLGGQLIDNKNYPDAGIEVPTYRGIPIYESNFLTSLGTMTSVTASATGSDGVIPAGTYYYSVEVVTDFGISVAAETTQVTVSSTNHVALSWTTPTITDALGNVRTNLLFRIHRTDTNGAKGTETLYAVISATENTHDDPVNNGVTSWTDTGAIVDPTADESTALAVTVAASGGIAVPDGVTPPHLDGVTGHTSQDIFLIPRDPDICVQAVVNEMQTVPLALVNARTQQVALLGDQVLAVRGPGFMAKASNVYVA